MSKNYSILVGDSFRNNKDAFREYILQKDTIIISDSGEEGLTCSQGVSEKLYNDMALLEKVKDSLFYKDGHTIYFIFSRYYEGIGEVRIFFDTTEYIRSQIIVIKVSVALIFIWFFIYLFGGKFISRLTLSKLKEISNTAKNIDVTKNYTPIKIDAVKEDEIKILATALNAAFCRIENQTRCLQQFITDVSHEFKTPLMVINSDIDLYEKKKEKGVLKKDDDSEFLISMRRKTAKLNTLIETLFLLTRMEENMTKLQFRKRDIGELLERLINEKLRDYKQKNVITNFHIQENILKNIEESSFNIIIENLISNALKFSKNPVILDISLTETYFSIQDNGIGMSMAETKRVWEKFYRLDTNTEGFGVGLFLVKRIIQLYTWDIQLDSKKGKYTKFTIYFNKN